MAILNRKMFNRGGPVSSRGVGITSGLVIPKYEHGGMHTQEDFFEQNKEMLSKYYQPQEEQSRLKAASPSLLALGSALLSGKSYQGGVGGALEILGGATEKATPYFDDMIKNRRAEKDAARKEAFNLDMKALDFARDDMAIQTAKYKPIEFGDSLLQLGLDGKYKTISSKPSKLVEAYDNVLNDNVFVSEALIRADMEATSKSTTNVPPGEEPYAQRYAVKRTIDKEDLVEVYDTEKNIYTYIPEDTLMELAKKAQTQPTFTPRYIAKAPETDLVTMYDEDLKKNVTLFKSTVVESINKNENKYSTKKDGLDTVKQVYSNALEANIYVTQGQLLADMGKETSDYSEPSANPVYKTFYDPAIQQNVLATDSMVAERLEEIPLFAFQPKQADKSDTILTMWHKKDKHNMLVTEAEVLANMEAYEPEHKQDATKSAIDTQDENKLVFVTNKEIAESEGRYTPAIIGSNLTIKPDGSVVQKSGFIGQEGPGIDGSDKQKELKNQLDTLTIFATDVLSGIEGGDADDAFGVKGWLIDWSNKYLTQIGMPFNEQVGQARTDITELSTRVMRLVSDDSRFTNEDRAYINKITGQAALEKLQSWDQVLLGVRQIQTMLEDRLTEVSGNLGQKASHEMDVQELLQGYDNYRKANGIREVNGIKWKGFDTYTIKPNIPTFNKRQLEKRLEIYHPEVWASIQRGDF